MQADVEVKSQLLAALLFLVFMLNPNIYFWVLLIMLPAYGPEELLVHGGSCAPEVPGTVPQSVLAAGHLQSCKFLSYFPGIRSVQEPHPFPGLTFSFISTVSSTGTMSFKGRGRGRGTVPVTLKDITLRSVIFMFLGLSVS